MTVETKSDLTDESIAQLQNLITANVNSLEGLKDAAEAVADPAVAKVFRQTLDERRRFPDELKTHLTWNGEVASKQESWAAKVHQAWMRCRAKLNSGDAHVVLTEAEYGEDFIKEAYEEALKSNPGSAVSEILHSQYATVKAGHDRIRDLRDAYARK